MNILGDGGALRRIKLCRITICIAFIIGILMSWPLWTSEREFPLIPFVDSFPQFSNNISIAAIIVVIGLLGLSAYKFFPRVFRIIFVLLFLLLIQDQVRMQAWVYLYILMLLPFLLRKKNEINSNLAFFQIIMIGLYLWSGIHKMSPAFTYVTFNDILVKLFGIDNQGTRESIMQLGYFVPVFEVLTAIALFFPRFRKAGVLMAISTHLFILVYLSPWAANWNHVVYPWNLAMMAAVWILFYMTDNQIYTCFKSGLRTRILNGIAVLLSILMPALAITGHWDKYMSFSLYSGKAPNYYIAVWNSQILNLRKNYSDYYLEAPDIKGGKIIDVNKWAIGEMNVPFYPETRAFKKLCKHFCRLGIPIDKIYFIEYFNPKKDLKFDRYKCTDLDQRNKSGQRNVG